MDNQYDIVIYGGTSVGCIAAIQAARLGKRVALLVRDSWYGGMTTNGLGWVDLKDPRIIGGMTREFFHRLWSYYENEDNWKWEQKKHIPGQLGTYDEHTQCCWSFEPKAAEQVFSEMLSQEPNIHIFYNIFIQHAVDKNGSTILNVSTSGGVFHGTVFIDCSYEGDLMSACGITNTIGRESKDKYGEEHNGVILPHHDNHRVDVTINARMLDRVVALEKIEPGDGDDLVQSYCFRLCMTDVRDNMIPIDKPEIYDDDDYEMLFRAIEAGITKEKLLNFNPLPNRKYDVNNAGPISLDYVGKVTHGLTILCNNEKMSMMIIFFSLEVSYGLYKIILEYL